MENKNIGQAISGMVFNMQSYSIHDGPGIRTVVFLKGCPLSCWWCCNPESISGQPELGFRQSLCNGCKGCVDVCPNKALSLEEGTNTLRIDRTLCDSCGACVQVCPRQALTIYGQKMDVIPQRSWLLILGASFPVLTSHCCLDV
jgi:pyruvate formate lyase activating enzyme